VITVYYSELAEMMIKANLFGSDRQTG